MGSLIRLFHEIRRRSRRNRGARKNGSLVSMDSGEATSYALNMIQERGRLMVVPGDMVYVGMIAGKTPARMTFPSIR